MAPNTRQRLIDSAKQRFYRDGFRNVGIDPILQDVGISKTAFYKHFESKDDLIVGVLEDVDVFLQNQFRAMVRQRGGRSARGQIQAILDVIEHIVEQEDFHGCIFVNAAMEFPALHDPAHAAALRHKNAIEDFLYELAERAGVLDPQAMTEEFCMIIEGSYVTRSVTRNVATFGIARRLIDQLLDRHLPGRDGESMAPEPDAARSDGAHATPKARKKRTRSDPSARLSGR